MDSPQPPGQKELSIEKKQQMEAIKLMAEWSKWLISIETAGVGGVVALAKLVELPGWERKLVLVPLLLTALCFLGSILYASYVLFTLPTLVERLPIEDSPRLLDMTGETVNGPYRWSVGEHAKWQYLLFDAGLGLLAVALVSWGVLSLSKP
jgi:hypothetical protein